jgi:protein-disulfide isomerase
MKKTKGKEVKKSVKKNNKKNYFEIIFVIVSVLMFLVLVFMIGWMKDPLYEAKDQAAIEFIKDYEEREGLKTLDPLTSFSEQTKIDSLAGPIDDGSDPALGKKDARVKIFYYLDFSCSFCSEQDKILKKIYDKFKDDVRIIWKAYPDSSFASSFSYQSAKAAYCAHRQGMFWDYGELLYDKKDPFETLRSDVFMDIARNLDMNIKSFERCFFSFETDEVMRKNMEEADALEIVAIPYIYINDKDFLGSLSEDELEIYINYEIEN